MHVRGFLFLHSEPVRLDFQLTMRDAVPASSILSTAMLRTPPPLTEPSSARPRPDPSHSHRRLSDVTSADEDPDHDHTLSGPEGPCPNPFFFGQPDAKLEPYQMRSEKLARTLPNCPFLTSSHLLSGF